MNLKKYPSIFNEEEDTQITIDFKDEKFKKLSSEILDTCKNCKIQKYVSYTFTIIKGRNICEECVEYEDKRKAKDLLNKVY